MKPLIVAFIGAFFGAAIALFLTILVGAFLGGVYQYAPCYGGAAYRSLAERILDGAIFGMMFFGFYYALPATAGGSVVGFIAASIFYLYRWRD